jgi:hypothetical protein
MKVLNRLLDGFDGNLTNSKWATHRQVFAGYGTARHQQSSGARGVEQDGGGGA